MTETQRRRLTDTKRITLTLALVLCYVDYIQYVSLATCYLILAVTPNNQTWHQQNNPKSLHIISLK